CESLKLGGMDMTNAILSYFRKTFNLVISDSRAEEIKLELGSAYKLPQERSMSVRGVSVESGLPSAQEIDSVTVREIITPIINQMVTAIKKSLEVLVVKPEIAVDIFNHGLYLVGGGALIPGIDKKITEETTIPVQICDDPITVVTRGMGSLLEDLKKHREIYTG
ncbi:MAG: rod shape-determining protein, partial [Chlorobiaceae bacterium]|nr:rod shape-determining protein [Chlorobiaceae bacterium]